MKLSLRHNGNGPRGLLGLSGSRRVNLVKLRKYPFNCTIFISALNHPKTLFSSSDLDSSFPVHSDSFFQDSHGHVLAPCPASPRFTVHLRSLCLRFHPGSLRGSVSGSILAAAVDSFSPAFSAAVTDFEVIDGVSVSTGELQPGLR